MKTIFGAKQMCVTILKWHGKIQKKFSVWAYLMSFIYHTVYQHMTAFVFIMNTKTEFIVQKRPYQ